MDTQILKDCITNLRADKARIIASLSTLDLDELPAEARWGINTYHADVQRGMDATIETLGYVVEQIEVEVFDESNQ